MRFAKYILLLSLFGSFGYCDQIFNQITQNIREDLGKDFNKEYGAFANSTSYPELLSLVKKESTVLSFEKKQLLAPKFDNIFFGLKAIDSRSSSIIPALYAYHYMEWSYGNKNRNFNRDYGYGFANKLAGRGLCQGYLWLAKLNETDAGLYKDSFANYSYAAKVCNGRYRMQALYGHALMRYFVTKKTGDKPIKYKAPNPVVKTPAIKPTAKGR